MTTWQSLLYCAASEVTLDRIRNLVAVTGTEPLTVDFKQGGNTREVAECAAAMANSHGGLILIGITDTDREIVGVPREAMAYVADVLATHLESPDWQPEVIEVPLGDDNPGRYVLVMRVDKDTAPRPVFVQVTAKFSNERRNIFYAPVRTAGSTRQATREELFTLFTEQRPAPVTGDGWDLRAPEIPSDRSGTTDISVDFALRSGLTVVPGLAAWGRPISERAITGLAAALDRSPLTEVLFDLSGTTTANVETFHREGAANRSNRATLVWRLEPRSPIFEITVEVEVPGHFGHSHLSAVQFTITVISRLSARAAFGRDNEVTRLRLHASQWKRLLEAVMATLTNPSVMQPVANISGIEPFTLRQPRSLHVVSVPEFSDLLPAGLAPIRNGGVSHGTHMLTDPALDLSHPNERAEQADRWLVQMASDAGLLGMEQMIGRIVRTVTD